MYFVLEQPMNTVSGYPVTRYGDWCAPNGSATSSGEFSKCYQIILPHPCYPPPPPLSSSCLFFAPFCSDQHVLLDPAVGDYCQGCAVFEPNERCGHVHILGPHGARVVQPRVLRCRGQEVQDVIRAYPFCHGQHLPSNRHIASL